MKRTTSHLTVEGTSRFSTGSFDSGEDRKVVYLSISNDESIFDPDIYVYFILRRGDEEGTKEILYALRSLAKEVERYVERTFPEEDRSEEETSHDREVGSDVLDVVASYADTLDGIIDNLDLALENFVRELNEGFVEPFNEAAREVFRVREEMFGPKTKENQDE